MEWQQPCCTRHEKLLNTPQRSTTFAPETNPANIVTKKTYQNCFMNSRFQYRFIISYYHQLQLNSRYMKQQLEETELQTSTHSTSNTEQIIKYDPNKEFKMKISNDDSDEDDRRPPQMLIHRKKYGNFILIRYDDPHMSLGPDYFCFIPAFLAFAVASYFLIQLVLNTTESYLFHIVTLFVCIGQPLSYLLVALSNPGVITESVREGPDSKNCLKCQMFVPRHARHCNDCNVCIGQYDHHCPWTSKCIGGGNLIRFYIFLGWTPIYLIYLTIAFVVCMSNNLIKVQQLSKQP